MDHFQYQDGTLCAEDVPLERIAAAVGTPFYCYSTATFERHYKAFSDALEGLDRTVCYAVKANSNVAILQTLAKLGSGADVVSIGEYKRAVLAGIPTDKIVFSGVGKTREELRAAITSGVMQINVESEPELEMLSEVAVEAGVSVSVALRINPDVDAHTHEKISTGKLENKFGIEWTRAPAVYKRASELPGLKARGIAVHIGSQLTDLEPFREAFIRMADLVAMLRADGMTVDRLDLGGGLGIHYGREGDNEPIPKPEEYGKIVRQTVGGLDCHLIFEPGRMIAGNAGVLVSRVVRVKEGATRTFVILDAAMNDLMRPVLYEAYHDIVPIEQPAADAVFSPKDVVGPICETGDTFATQRPLPPVAGGDLLAFRTAGAYGAVMASTYNTRALVPEVLVAGNAFAIVRKRLDVDELIALDRVPDWL